MSRVLIIGAGPAGICAAQSLVAAGLSPVVVDSAARAGGQIYRRPPEGFTRSATTLYGSEAEKARRLHRDFDALVAQKKIAYLPSSTVMALGPGAAEVVGPEGRCTLKFDRLILASGATDRLAPVPGWELPGTYSLGAAQIALKAQGVALGRKIVLAGSGPLLTLLACQLRHAGAEVAAILDTAPMSGQIRHGLAMACARPWVTLRGFRMRLSLGQSYHAGVSLERIDGDSGGVRALHWRDGRGRAHVTACDMVAMGWHLRADTILA
ncbi:NAD(P)/FAD-dependent oxidoreductase, partial [Thioclava sp. BHET1]